MTEFKKIRVGIVGLGENTRFRHVPGLRACPEVEILAVCNRSRESTEAAAHELNIPRTYEDWRQLVDEPDLDAIVVGTWPNMHCAVTIRALEAEKHVLTEARMAMNLAEARMMFEASKRKPHLVAQVVPSPFGLCADGVIRELLDKNVLGPLREVVVLSTDGSFADPHVPIHWRKLSEFSGKNMLELGILHEMLGRWIPEPTRVFAQTQIFTPSRSHSGTDQPIKVETPDCVHVLADLPNGARAVYRCCDSVRFGPTRQIRFYGSKGSLKCLFDPEDRLFVGQSGETEMTEVTVNSDDHRGWRVEAEFIGAIRGEVKVRFADFASGVRYMEFTEAVAQSAASGQAVDLPLA